MTNILVGDAGTSFNIPADEQPLQSSCLSKTGHIVSLLADSSKSSNLNESHVSMSFLEILNSVVANKKDKCFATWYDKKGSPTESYTFEQIWKEAGFIARNLRIERGLAKGDRVILCYSPGLKFFAAFLGCLRAGVVAVLIYPPSPSNLATALPKMNSIATDCDAKIILVDPDVNKLRLIDRGNPLSRSCHLWPRDIQFAVHPRITKRNRKKGANADFEDSSTGVNDIAFLQ